MKEICIGLTYGIISVIVVELLSGYVDDHFCKDMFDGDYPASGFGAVIQLPFVLGNSCVLAVIMGFIHARRFGAARIVALLFGGVGAIITLLVSGSVVSSVDPTLRFESLALWFVTIVQGVVPFIVGVGLALMSLRRKSSGQENVTEDEKAWPPSPSG